MGVTPACAPLGASPPPEGKASACELPGPADSAVPAQGALGQASLGEGQAGRGAAWQAHRLCSNLMSAFLLKEGGGYSRLNSELPPTPAPRPRSVCHRLRSHRAASIQTWKLVLTDPRSMRSGF